jgi:ureidoglycolate lyase
MGKLAVKQLDAEGFKNYGAFVDLSKPESFAIGSPPCEFFRDMIVLDLGVSTSASFSICRVNPRPDVVDILEYHNNTGEGILPLDGDVLLCFAPASPPGGIPLCDAEVFFVPQHTMVTIRPGVWHYAPYATGSESVNVLIVLPERTYAKDCTVVEIPNEEQPVIERI